MPPHTARTLSIFSNEHSMHYRETGLLDTQEYLDTVGIAHVGASIDAAEAFGPRTIKSLGRNIAFMSISGAGSGIRDAAGQDMWAASETRGGIAYTELWEPAQHPISFGRIRAALDQLRQSTRVSLVVCSVCWGRGAAGAAARAIAAL